MKSFKIYVVLLLAGSLCFIAPQNSRAQSLKSLEDSYFNMLSDYFAKNARLDSLTAQYSKQISLINQAKMKAGNRTNVEELLSEGVVISNRIDSLQNKIGALKEKINSRKIVLDNIYARKIDSLKTLENNKSAAVNKDKVNLEKLGLIEKRLLVRPQIKALSYNPKELISLTNTLSGDSSNSRILSEYVIIARKEVNSQISEIDQMIGKINELLSLQQKVEDFIEESEMQSNIGRFSSYSSNRTGTDKNSFNDHGEIGTNYDFARNAVDLVSQTSTYSMLFDQLKISDNLATNNLNKWNKYINDNSGFIPLPDFKDMLVDIKKYLQEYDKLLKNKVRK